MLVGLDHIQIAIPPGSEEEARRFYGGLLGLKEVPKPEALRRRGGCWFVGPGIELHLGVEDPHVPARKAHPAFRVADLDALRSQLEGAGVTTVSDELRPRVRRFYAYDPSGNRLEFVELD